MMSNPISQQTTASARIIDVCEIREAFCERVKAHDEESDWREVKADAIDLVCDGEKADHGESPQCPGARQRNDARWNMTLRGPWIFGIKTAVHDAVESHGTGPGAENGGDDEEEFLPAGPAAVFEVPRGHHHRCKREWKRENGVGDFYEFAPLGELRQWIHLKGTNLTWFLSSSGS
jgi:hypothetical protein